MTLFDLNLYKHFYKINFEVKQIKYSFIHRHTQIKKL